jgi:hypothetical protein
MFAFAAPLGAEVNENGAAISAALTNGKSNEALALISQAFSALKPGQTAEAKTLVKSILVITPIELSGQVVVTAIEANPSLGEAPFRHFGYEPNGTTRDSQSREFHGQSAAAKFQCRFAVSSEDAECCRRERLNL